MDEAAAKAIADRTISSVFGFQNPYDLHGVLEKFAFDIRLPKQVQDHSTGETTWSQSTHPSKFLTLTNADTKPAGYWKKPRRQFNNVDEVLQAWMQINDAVTERQLDSLNVVQSDNVYQSRNVFRSLDINESENVLFCDGISTGGDHIIACQRSKNLRNCIRVEDSKDVQNSFSIIWSKNVKNSYFLSDVSDVEDSIFCSHVSNVRYMVANVQLDEAEYRRVKAMVIRWILTA